MSNLYQTDIALWAEQQAQLLRCFARYGPAFSLARACARKCFTASRTRDEA